jgi:hypothetical protein
LEGHIFNDGWELMVVTNHDPALETVEAVLWRLQQQWNESLNLQDLGRFFHQDVIVLHDGLEINQQNKTKQEKNKIGNCSNISKNEHIRKE